MAYRDPETLTCPTCKASGQVVWLVGEGPPGSEPNPAYVELMDPGPFRAKTTATQPDWRGVISCHKCGADVERGS